MHNAPLPCWCSSPVHMAPAPTASHSVMRPERMLRLRCTLRPPEAHTARASFCTDSAYISHSRPVLCLLQAASYRDGADANRGHERGVRRGGPYRRSEGRLYGVRVCTCVRPCVSMRACEVPPHHRSGGGVVVLI